jgi:hypothetical protein
LRMIEESGQPSGGLEATYLLQVAPGHSRLHSSSPASHVESEATQSESGTNLK